MFGSPPSLGSVMHLRRVRATLAPDVLMHGDLPGREDGTGVSEPNDSAAHPARRQLSIVGVEWTVYEVPGAALVFESEQIVRRIATYPPNWRTLSDAELYALSWST